MSAPPKVLDLIDLFRRNTDAYHAPLYNEAMVRQEFINPLFKCLGWDMDNEHGYAEAYKDVIHEAAIKIGGATKAPDYCFRIGGSAKFFLEAKRPSISIDDDDIDPQAVEVTKLSLLLKVLEGESEQTLQSRTIASQGEIWAR